MSKTPPYIMRWSAVMRIVSLVMACHLFMLPQVLTAQSLMDTMEQDVQQPPQLLEEEVLKHACSIHHAPFAPVNPDASVELMHQYEERMLDHPLLEVPHQPPK